eukprot:TRINITY_DN17459_c0_g1_i1.p1 TRINITY_DN17459_c0_g1~~TRINITY_DN17459_c0_g1_i1.p1  ORF type:complete len:389 (+),score=141.29 TRINITY_DN17459_c0_g1_i1:56-1168(+)
MAEDLWRLARHLPADGDMWPEGQQPPQLAEHSAVALDRDGRKVMLVFGGWAPQADSHSSALWEYDLRDRKWAALQVPAERGKGPPGRCAHCATAGGWGMLVWGGWSGDSLLHDGWHLVPTDGHFRWVQLPGDMHPRPAPRRGASMVTVSAAGDPCCAYMHGGVDDATRFGDLWQLSSVPGGEWMWREVHCGGVLAPPPRDAHALAFDRERRQLLLHGGFTTARCDDLYSLPLPEDADGELRSEWCREVVRRGAAPRPLAGHSAFVVGGSLVVLHGSDVVERRDVAELPLPTGPPAEEGAPPCPWAHRTFTGDWPLQRRTYHSCCQCVGADGQPEAKLIVFGGWDGAAYLNTVTELEFERPADAPADRKKK